MKKVDLPHKVHLTNVLASEFKQLCYIHCKMRMHLIFYLQNATGYSRQMILDLVTHRRCCQSLIKSRVRQLLEKQR